MKPERLTFVLLAALALLGLGFGNPCPSLVEEGNRLYEDGDFEGALVKYNQALLELPEAEEIRYNIGGVHHLRGDYETAAALYRAILDSPDPVLASRAAYNLGNTLFREEDYGRAAEAYKTALKLDAGDEDARYNYELARQFLLEPPPPPPEPEEKQEQEEEEEQPEEQPPPEEQEEETGEEESQPPPPEEGPDEEQPSPDQPEEGELDPEDVERLLDAMLSEEEDYRAEIREKEQEDMEETWKDW
jgi:Ca-activated chloride channel homolog